MRLVETAWDLGFPVYVVNPKEFAYFRRSVNFRVKSDASDAAMLAHYVDQQHSRLRTYSPPKPELATAQALLTYRATLVRARVAIEESYKTLPPQARAQAGDSGILALNRQIADLDAKIQDLVNTEPAYELLLQIPGIGPKTATALICAFSRGTFASSDAFVAYAGLDLRICDSGKHVGQRKLSKRGDRLLRCLMYTAAVSGVKCPCWKPYHERYKAKGWRPIQSILIVARKMLRLTWSIMTNLSEFDPKRLVHLDIKP